MCDRTQQFGFEWQKKRAPVVTCTQWKSIEWVVQTSRNGRRLTKKQVGIYHEATIKKNSHCFFCSFVLFPRHHQVSLLHHISVSDTKNKQNCNYGEMPRSRWQSVKLLKKLLCNSRITGLHCMLYPVNCILRAKRKKNRKWWQRNRMR